MRLYGDTALLSGSTHMTGTYDGKAFESNYRYIDIYVRRDGTWKIVSVQVTKFRRRSRPAERLLWQVGARRGHVGGADRRAAATELRPDEGEDLGEIRVRELPELGHHIAVRAVLAFGAAEAAGHDEHGQRLRVAFHPAAPGDGGLHVGHPIAIGLVTGKTVARVQALAGRPGIRFCRRRAGVAAAGGVSPEAPAQAAPNNSAGSETSRKRMVSRLPVGDPPDAALLRVRDVQRAIRRDRQTHRSIARIVRIVVGHVAGETIGEHLVVATGLAVLHRLEDHLVAGLRLGSAVPAAVECDERAALVLRREILARIEQQVVRGPVPPGRRPADPDTCPPAVLSACHRHSARSCACPAWCRRRHRASRSRHRR